MPASMIKTFAEKSGKSEKDVERLYEESKKIVEKEYNKTEKDGESFYQLVTGVLKKMLGISKSDALCGGCGSGVSISDAYCHHCGSQLMDFVNPFKVGDVLKVDWDGPSRIKVVDITGNKITVVRLDVNGKEKTGGTDTAVVSVSELKKMM